MLEVRGLRGLKTFLAILDSTARDIFHLRFKASKNLIGEIKTLIMEKTAFEHPEETNSLAPVGVLAVPGFR